MKPRRKTQDTYYLYEAISWTSKKGLKSQHPQKRLLVKEAALTMLPRDEHAKTSQETFSSRLVSSARCRGQKAKAKMCVCSVFDCSTSESGGGGTEVTFGLGGLE